MIHSRFAISDFRFPRSPARQVSGLLVIALLAVGCSAEKPKKQAKSRAVKATEELVGRVDDALAAAARFLVSKQSDDGAWRSAVYGCFRDGPELTPHVLSCLFFLPQGGESVRPAFDKGASFMMKLVTKEGAIEPGPHGLNFPVFTAGAASRVVVLEKKDEPHLRARSAWLAYLRERQLVEANGWQFKDPQYGGWGFSVDIPQKPRPHDLPGRFYESNLVGTLYGIAALRSAKVPLDDPIYQKTLTFVKRCQNFSDNLAKGDPYYDDGGFFFIPGEPVQNKAGVAGTDKWGRTRFRSYGTMTADGLRALIRCGLPLSHPRVVAARRWLEVNFAVDQNAGAFLADREILRNATYFYYGWSLAHAMIALDAKEVLTRKGGVRWAEALAKELLARQRDDGSWRNIYTDAKEDDPLVATPLAASALAICRGVITGEHKAIGRPCLTEPPEPKEAPDP
ncbi:MAG TPA: hypothetical protein VNE39_16030 [Planctomycetota bacterium]|nr:hypothetical protein [Planctomycetota bacterium]